MIKYINLPHRFSLIYLDSFPALAPKERLYIKQLYHLLADAARLFHGKTLTQDLDAFSTRCFIPKVSSHFIVIIHDSNKDFQVPVQKDEYSCGVFACWFANKFLHDPKGFVEACTSPMVRTLSYPTILSSFLVALQAKSKKSPFWGEHRSIQISKAFRTDMEENLTHAGSNQLTERIEKGKLEENSKTKASLPDAATENLKLKNSTGDGKGEGKPEPEDMELDSNPPESPGAFSNLSSLSDDSS